MAPFPGTRSFYIDRIIERVSAESPIRAYLGRFSDNFAPMLAGVLPGERVVAWPDDTPSEIIAALPVDHDGLAAAITPEVQWVHVLGAGVDGFPLGAAGDRMVTCSRGASAVAISEFVMATMLAFEKHLPQSWITEPPEQWNAAQLGGLKDRTLALVGVGAIGTEIARRALAFEMRVVAVRRSSAPPPLPEMELARSLPELLARADHLVVAAPATGATRHLLDGDAFAALKPGAHLVNIARGSIVDQDALIDALDAGRVAVASLDVSDPEPLPAGHPLYTHPRVRFSPHISWSSPTTMLRTIELFAENLRRYRAGEPLHGVVDLAAGY